MPKRILVTAICAVVGQFMLLLCAGFAGLGTILVLPESSTGSIANFIVAYSISLTCGCLIGYLSNRVKVGSNRTYVVSFLMIPIGTFLTIFGQLLICDPPTIFSDASEIQKIDWITPVPRLIVTLVLGSALLYVFKNRLIAQE